MMLCFRRVSRVFGRYVSRRSLSVCVFRDVYRALILVLLATGFGAPALIVIEKRRDV